MNLGLKDRVALVTGSSRGIGRVTAELLAAEGARVAVTYRHDCGNAEHVAAGIRAGGGDACVVYLDLADHDTIRAAVQQVLARWERLDVLINNAVEWVDTSESGRRFEDLPPTTWQALLHSNIDGVYATIQAVLPSMREHSWGRVVNVSSVAADDGMVGFAWYASAKAALHGLTRTLARELGTAGILVNAVMPGGTSTERVVTQMSPAVLQHRGRSLPIGRLPRPEEVAAAIAFLASDANTIITGEIVRASGGRR